MAGGLSKTNSSNSHPSNPIHKQATQAQGLVKKKKTYNHTDRLGGSSITDTSHRYITGDATTDTTTDPADPHDVNKALVAVVCLF